MLIAVLQYPGTLSASSDTHNLHIFSSFLFFVRSRLASGLARKKKTKGEEKRGLNSSHLAILSLAHTPEHYTNMVKHNNEIPHQHFKKDWQGYVILSFYAASIIRVLENARRNAFIFSLFCFTRTNLRIHRSFITGTARNLSCEHGSTKPAARNPVELVRLYSFFSN